MVFLYAMLLDNILTSPFRTSISYQLMLCFSQLQNQMIHEFSTIDLLFSWSYLCPHGLQYLFLIPTVIEKQFFQVISVLHNC